MPAMPARHLTALLSVLLVVVALDAGMPAATRAASNELQGAAGHRHTKGMTFATLKDVVAYGKKRYPKPSKVPPPDEELPGFDRAKDRANAGLGEPTTKTVIEANAGRTTSRSGTPTAGRRRRGIPNATTPVLGRTFLGMTGGNPADSAIAAGPHNIVVATNVGIQVLAKNGTPLVTPGSPTTTPLATLPQFFASLAP